MNEFITLIKRELKSIRREKTIVFAIFIQLFIASFSSMMLLGIMSFYDPESIGENTSVTVNIGVVGDSGSPVVDRVEEKKNVRVKSYRTIEEAEEAFSSRRIDAIMSIPWPDGTGVTDMKLILPESDTQSTIILMTLSEPFKNAENELRRANGIDMNYTDIEGKSNTSYEFLYSIIIPLLMFFPALIAGSIVIDTVSEELEHKTLDTLWSSPITLNKIFSSKIFAAIITALIQCVLWVVLLRANAFHVYNFTHVLTLSIFIAAAISFGAAIIGLHFKDRERAQFVYSIALLLTAGLGYLIDPSPLSLISRLATGSHYVDFSDVLMYFIPPVAVGLFFYFVSRKLASAQT